MPRLWRAWITRGSAFILYLPDSFDALDLFPRDELAVGNIDGHFEGAAAVLDDGESLAQKGSPGFERSTSSLGGSCRLMPASGSALRSNAAHITP